VANFNEQQQAEALKAWWRKYGTWIMLAIAIIAIVIAGIRFWHKHANNASKVPIAMIFKICFMMKPHLISIRSFVDYHYGQASLLMLPRKRF